MRRNIPAALLGAVLVSTSAASQTEEGFLETSDGVRLYFEKSGSGAATLILPGRLFLYPDFRVLDESFTVIAYDMRNRGRSSFVQDGSLLTLEHDVQDLEAVRRHFGVERFSTVGYSYLGKMVVFYALRHPERVRRIVQIGAVPMALATEYPAELRNDDREQVLDPKARARLRALREEDFHLQQPEKYCEEEWLVTRVLLVGDSADVDKLGEGNCAMPNEWPTNFTRHLFHHFGSMSRFDLTAADVAGLRHPVLTVHGTKDRNAPYGGGKEWAEALPNARLFEVEGAAHQAWVDRPDVLAAIREFLASH
jgi:pimeloyl-ACP methyl ester carboxylesterase